MGFYWNYIGLILLFLIAALLLNGLAYRQGYFRLPQRSSNPFLPFRALLVLFLIYLGICWFLQSTLITLAYNFWFPTLPIAFFVWLHVGSITLALLLYLLYMHRAHKEQMPRIWKDHSIAHTASIAKDCLIGALTWVLGFPVITTVGLIGDTLIYGIYGVHSYEQSAARFFKMTLGHPITMIGAFLAVCVLGPIMEEFLFRGILQTYLKTRIGPKAAILGSSLIFALVHYTHSQSVGNLSLIPALFSFACYLGFIYEKQASLFAPIALHITLNTISSVRIALFPEL